MSDYVEVWEGASEEPRMQAKSKRLVQVHKGVGVGGAPKRLVFAMTANLPIQERDGEAESTEK